MLETLAKELNENIKQTLEYKEFLSAKKALESNEKLIALKENLEKMKHIMCKSDDEAIKEEYKKAMDEYQNSPLVLNYNLKKDNLEDLLSSLMKIISNNL